MNLTLFLVLLGITVLFAQENLCTVTGALTSFNNIPDGLSGKFFSDKYWDTSICNTPDSIRYDSGLVTRNDISQSFLPSGLSSSNFASQRILRVDRLNKKVTFSANFTITCIVNGQIGGISLQDIKVMWNMQKNVILDDIDTLDQVVASWNGNLTTLAPNSPLRIQDSDIFDRVLPIFIIPGQAKQILQNPNEKLESNAKSHLATLSPQMAISNIPSGAIRQVFYNPEAGLIPDRQMTSGRIWFPSLGRFSESGSIQTVNYQTLEQDSTMTKSLDSILSKSIKRKCSTWTLVPSTFKATHSLQYFTSETYTSILSFKTQTEAMYACQNGFIGVSMTSYTSGINDLWRTETLNTNSTSIGLWKALPTKLEGYLKAMIQDGSNFYTTSNENLFGDLQSGKLLLGHEKPTNQLISNIFNTIKEKLMIDGISEHNQKVDEIFNLESSSVVSEAIKLFKSRTRRPTLRNMLDFIAQEIGAKILFDANESNASFYTTIKVNSKTNVDGVENQAVKTLNKVLVAYNVTITSPDQIDSFQLQGILFSSLKLENLNDLDRFEVSLIQPNQFSVNSHFKVPSLNISTVSFDYKTNKVSFVYNDMSFNENGVVANNFNINPSLFALQMESLLEYEKNPMPWLFKSIPLIDHNLGNVGNSNSWSQVVKTLIDLIKSRNPKTMNDFKILVENHMFLVCKETEQCVSSSIITPSRDSTLQFKFDWSSINDFHFHQPSGTFFSRIDRHLTSALVLSSLSAQISTTRVFDHSYSIGLNHQDVGFRLPITHNMDILEDTSSKWTLSFDIPRRAEMTLQASTSNGIGSIVTIDNLLVEKPLAHQKFMGVPEHHVLSPDEIVIELFEKILKSDEFVIKQLPHVALDKYIDFSQMRTPYINKLHSWVKLPIQKDSPIIHLEISPHATSIDPMVFIFNSEVQISCPIGSLDRTSDESMTRSINSALEECGLNTMLVAHVPDVPNTLAGATSFPIYSNLGSNQWITALNTNGTSNPDKTSVLNGYVGITQPVFESFEEMIWIMHGLIGSPIMDSKSVSVKTSDLSLPQEVLPFLPETYTSTMWYLEDNFDQSLENLEHARHLEAQNGTISLEFQSGKVSNGKANIHLEFEVGNVWVSGLNTPMLATQFDEDGHSIYDPVAPGKDQFSLEINLEVRNRDKVMPIQHQIHYTAPIGSSLADIPQFIQIPEEYKQNLKVYVQNASDLYDSEPRVVFELERSMKDTSIVLPLSIKIVSSSIIGFQVSSSIPSSCLTIMRSYKTYVDIDYDLSSFEIQSRMNTIHMITPSSIGRSEFNAIATQKRETMDIDSFKPSFGLEPIKDLSLHITSYTQFSFPEVNLNISSSLLPNVEMIWKVEQDLIVSTKEELIQYQNTKQDATVEYRANDQETMETFDRLSQQVNNQDYCDILDSIRNRIKKFVDAPFMNVANPFTRMSGKDIISKSILEKVEATQTRVCQQINEFTLEKFCGYLQDSFSQQVCFNQTVGVKFFQVTLRLEKFLYQYTDTLELNNNIIGNALKLYGSDGGIVSNAQSALEFTISANWETGKLKFEILDGAFVSTSLKLKMDADIEARVGPLSLALVGANIHIGHPSPIMWKAVFDRSSSPRVEISGNAYFGAKIKCLGRDVCSFSVSIPNVYEYFKNPEQARIVDQRTCSGGSLATSLQTAFSKSGIARFLSDPGRFLQDWSKGIKSIWTRSFTGTKLDNLRKLGLPVIQFAAFEMVRREMDRLANGKLSNELADGLREIARGLIFNNQTQVELYMLRAFTQLLCKKLEGLAECPPVPPVGSEPYSWKLNMIKKVEKTLVDIQFPIRDKTIGKFTSNVNLKLFLELSLRFKLTFSRSRGFYIEFDQERVLEAQFRLPMDSIVLRGMLGFLGAELRSKAGSGITAGMWVSNTGRTWEGDFEYKGFLEADAILGIAGKIKQDLQGQKSPVEEFLHFLLDIRIDFFHSLERGRGPKITVGNIKMCLGAWLARFAGGFFQRAKKFIEPMAKIVGRNGVLGQRVRIPPKTELTVAEIIILWARTEGRGHFSPEQLRTVMRIVRELEELGDMLDRVRRFVPDDSKLCSIWRKGQGFVFDIETGKKEFIGPEPDDNIESNGTLDPNDEEAAKSTFSRMNRIGGFSISYPITRHSISEIIINALLGIHMDLVKVTLPGLEFEAQKSWSMTVYCCPQVDVFFKLYTQIILQPPDIVLTTEAFTSIVRTRRIQSLTRGIWFVAMNPDGSPRPLVKAVFQVEAGASVTVFILEARISFYLQLRVNILLMSVNGLPKIRMDELAKPLQCVSLQMGLYWGMNLRISLCIRIRTFWKTYRWCWTLWSWHFGPYKLWEQTWRPSLPPPPENSNGEVDMNTLNQNGGGSIVLNDDMLIVSDPRDAFPISAPPSRSDYRFVGIPTSPVIIEVVTNHKVSLPSHINVNPVFHGTDFDHDVLIISESQVRPLGKSEGVVLGVCGKAVLNNMVYANALQITGIPCNQAIIDATGTKAHVAMKTTQIGSKTMQINGESHIDVSIQPNPSKKTSTIVISKEIVIADSVPLFTYKDTQILTIKANETVPTTFTIQNVADDTLLEIVGSNLRDYYNVEDIWAGKRDIIIEGLGDADILQTKLKVDSKQSLDLLITGTMTFATTSDKKRTISKSNVAIQKYWITSGDESKAQISLGSLGNSRETYIYTMNTVSGIISQNYSSCDPENGIHAYIDGSGKQTIYLGPPDQMSCIAYITGRGTDRSDYHVVVDATKNQKDLELVLVGNELVFKDPLDSSYIFRLIIEAIPNVHILFSETKKTRMIVRDTPMNTNYFVKAPVDQQVAKICRVRFGTNFAFEGAMNVLLQANNFECASAVPFTHPLQLYEGTIALLGKQSNLEISSDKNFDQEYYMNRSCILATVNEKPMKQLIPWTQNFVAKLAEYQISNSGLCEVVYATQSIETKLITGNGEDLIRMHQLEMTKMTLEANNGRNWIEFNESKTPTDIVSGKQGSELVIVSPTGKLNVMMGGGYGQANVIRIYPRNYLASIKPDGSKTIVGPLGPNEGDDLVLVSPSTDLINLHYGPIPGPDPIRP